MLKIIVIDDSQTVRDELNEVLSAAGFVVIVAEDGQEGAKAVHAHPDASLAICDVHMPTLSGLELLELLHEEGTSTVPFLMLTTQARSDLLDRARALGAKGWMVKPFKPRLLIAAVKKLARGA
ncbi:MAG: response regulator [Polyangiaceae bacterium]